MEAYTYSKFPIRVTPAPEIIHCAICIAIPSEKVSNTEIDLNKA